MGVRKFKAQVEVEIALPDSLLSDGFSKEHLAENEIGDALLDSSVKLLQLVEVKETDVCV